MIAASCAKGEFFFAVGTIGRSTRAGRKPSTLLQAARHNRRAIQTELGAGSHIDAERICLNETLAGPATPPEVVALAQSSMFSAGVVVDKLRKDYTQAIELLFSLSADTDVDIGNYFRRCVDWVGERFGAANILSADIHRDESVPHCHVLLLPLVGGRMCGSKLITRPELAKLRMSLERDVARGFGLKKPPGRMTNATRGQAAQLILDQLESTQDAVMNSALWLPMRRAIEQDPAPFLAALGIEAKLIEPPRKTRTMTEIFTSPGKGPKAESVNKTPSNGHGRKPIGFGGSPTTTPSNHAETELEKPIGFDSHPQAYRNLSCVGFAPATPVFELANPAECRWPEGLEADCSHDRQAPAAAPRQAVEVGAISGQAHPDNAGSPIKAVACYEPAFPGPLPLPYQRHPPWLLKTEPIDVPNRYYLP